VAGHVAAISISRPLLVLSVLGILCGLLEGYLFHQVQSSDFLDSSITSLEAESSKLHWNQIQTWYGAAPGREELLFRCSNVLTKESFDEMWSLHEDIETRLAAQNVTIKTTRRGALAFWESSQDYGFHITDDDQLLLTIADGMLSDGKPAATGEMFGGEVVVGSKGMTSATAALIEYDVPVEEYEGMADKWRGAVIGAGHQTRTGMKVYTKVMK
jgi:hypothetical protein